MQVAVLSVFENIDICNKTCEVMILNIVDLGDFFLSLEK